MGLEVIAFEPDPKALHTLRARFPNHPKLTVVPKAVGGSARSAKFYRRPDENTEWSSLNHHEVHEGGEVLDVEVVDIVEFVRGKDVAVHTLPHFQGYAEATRIISDCSM